MAITKLSGVGVKTTTDVTVGIITEANPDGSLWCTPLFTIYENWSRQLLTRLVQHSM